MGKFGYIWVLDFIDGIFFFVWGLLIFVIFIGLVDVDMWLVLGIVY